LPVILTSADIETAQAVVGSARHYCEVKAVLKEQQASFLQQTQLVLQKVSEELSKAITVLYKLKPQLSALAEDVELKSYLKALPEVYFIALRLSKVLQLCCLAKPFEHSLGEISQHWEECKDFLPGAVPEFRSEDGSLLCGLCLFGSSQLVLLCSSHFHVACVNFWINRVSTEPPRLCTANYSS
jgi:hypothetical protein